MKCKTEMGRKVRTCVDTTRNCMMVNTMAALAGLVNMSKPEKQVDETTKQDEVKRWFVMRDLKRCNAKNPAYKMLQDLKFEVFTPMKWHVATRKGEKIREEIPVIRDLLFVHSNRSDLDPIVEKTETLQYRFLRRTWREPMTVMESDMERFIHAVNSSKSVKYYLPEELATEMYNKKIRIIGGNLDGYEGKLLTVRGSKTKRLLVELPGALSVGVEVSPEFIQLI